MLLGRLIVDDVSQMSRGRIQDLLTSELKWTTLLLWFIWYVSSLSVFMWAKFLIFTYFFLGIKILGTKQFLTEFCVVF